MSRKKKTNSNNLVIVCEGTDTEYLYFSELKEYVLTNYPDRFCVIKIVPAPNETITQKNPRRNHLSRKMLGAPQFHYYSKFEKSEADYNRYCAQPTRYVREVALFIEEDGYNEGWAVFDNDKHPDLENAFRYASQVHVGIAFSSYSFEEWFLAHFERNRNAFHRSECKEAGKELHCGALNASDNGCQGQICLAGRIRSQSYIPDYSKNKKGLFTTYTLPKIKNAMINAAWLRFFSEGAPWTCNPYTDVDVLIARMLGISNSYRWYKEGDVFSFGQSSIRVSFDDNGDVVISNEGESTVLIQNEENAFLDEDLSYISSGGRIFLAPEASCEIRVPRRAVALILTSVRRNSIIDLTNITHQSTNILQE